MYRIGDKVMHRNEGACYIREMVNLKMADDEMKEFYVLVPLLNLKANIYISVDQKKQTSIRPVIEMKELDTARTELRERPLPWMENPKQRFLTMSKSINDFQFQDALLTMECLERQGNEKALSISDKNLLSLAQKLVYSELAIVLDVEYQDVCENSQHYLAI